MTNITTIKFCGNIATAPALYQYDYGQRLVFQNIDLPSVYEVHFANAGDTDTITALGDDDGVIIPDELLLDSGSLYAYIYLHAGNDDGETEYKATIPVLARPKPSETQPTPVQQDIIEQAIAKLTEAVEDYENIITATEEDEGKALTVKTVEDGKVTEWEFKSGGGGGGTTDYTDLDNKPKINNVTLTGNKTTADLNLFSGDYDDLTNKPTIPTKVSDLTNDAGYITQAPVTSVNGETGAVVLDAEDVGAYSLPSGGIPKSDLTSSVRTSLEKADTALQTAPVSSVDGKTGAVTVLPSGGTTGQILKKTSGTDYAVEWANESSGGTSDYTDLTNKPSINSVTLSGNKTSSDLGLLEASDITASKSGDTTTIYVDGTAIAQVKDGTNGTDGTDGITPLTTVTAITGGHNVAFSYGTGDPRNTNFDVMDGTTPIKGTDYWTAQDQAAIVQDVVTAISPTMQTKAITDTGGYYTTDTVEGALQEIGAEIAGVNTLIGTGVIS